MPEYCSAYGCSNRRNTKTKENGITFHKFPKNEQRRKAWLKAMRRDFTPNMRTVVCSCHFEEKDFDRTGQTIRLREGVVPSVFNFPKTSRKPKTYSAKESPPKNKYAKVLLPPPPEAKKLPAAGIQKARKSIRRSSRRDENINSGTSTVAPEPVVAQAPTPNPSGKDHHYAIDPDSVKQKLVEAQARVEELQKQLRNSRDRERRKDAVVRVLLRELKRQNMFTKELLDSSELWVLSESHMERLEIDKSPSCFSTKETGDDGGGSRDQLRAMKGFTP